jgi:dihydroceramidase
MMFTTTPVLHRVMTANASPRVTIIVGMVLGSTLLALVIYHVKTDELLLQSLFFVGSVTAIGISTMRMINTRTRAGSEARRQIWGMVRFGAGNILPYSDIETPPNLIAKLYSIWVTGSGWLMGGCART